MKTPPPKVLLVDDDPDLLRALSTRLRAEGFGVVTASDGVMAVSVARRYQPDLVILDLGLPGGDGYSVLERLKNLTPTSGTPILVLTARDPKVHDEKSRAAGADGFLQKPADASVLLAEVRRLLGIA